MPAEIAENREPYLRLIENQAEISNRYTGIKRLDERGGKGFFSIMFTAFDKITGEEAVLKFFHPVHFSNVDRLARFYREGEILLKLKGQPNILECLDGVCRLPILLSDPSGIQIPQEYLYIPMKKASGSIEDKIYSEGIKPEKYLIYFREMCKAVARIQGLTISHRDLKPGNFLVFGKNDIRLGDFGTAKFLDGSMPDIRPDYVLPLGDVSYLSPEVMCEIGIGDKISLKADTFSLGAILFEMFTKQVLADYAYTKDFNDSLQRLSILLSMGNRGNRLEYYLSSIDMISNLALLPDIFSFNDFVPNCIKYHLNSLYKDMTKMNFSRRLSDFASIYRRIDICLFTLRNETKYQKWLQRRKGIREARMRKIIGGCYA